MPVELTSNNPNPTKLFNYNELERDNFYQVLGGRYNGRVVLYQTFAIFHHTFRLCLFVDELSNINSIAFNTIDAFTNSQFEQMPKGYSVTITQK